MTTAAAEPCGHRWLRTLCPASGYSGHRCAEPAGHDRPGAFAELMALTRTAQDRASSEPPKQEDQETTNAI